MNKDKEPLLSSEEYFNTHDFLTDFDFAQSYAKYHTEWHLNKAIEVVCEDAMVDDFTNYPHSTVDKQSITNAIENYIKENL